MSPSMDRTIALAVALDVVVLGAFIAFAQKVKKFLEIAVSLRVKNKS